MPHVTLKLEQDKDCKHVVRFASDEEDLLFTNIYISKEQAKKQLKVKDLTKAKAVEVTVRVVE
jgi:hypothetical protein